MLKTMLSHTTMICFALQSAALYVVEVAYEIDPNAEVLGKVGQVFIQKEFCNKDGYDCDYALYDAKGQRELLLEDWS